MTTGHLGSTNAGVVNAEIDKIDRRISSIADEIQFANNQLNGTAAVYLYSEAELSSKPYLVEEQKVLFPSVMGAIEKDRGFKNILLNTLQPIITSYEIERRALDGQYPQWNSTSVQIVILANDFNGASGSVTITDTIANPNFLVAGMQNGTASRPARGAIKPTPGIEIISHETITISDGSHAAKVFEFYRGAEPITPGRVGIQIADGDSPATIAGKILAAINGAPNLDVTANTTLFDLFDDNMMQTSGVARLKPLFDPSIDFFNLENPGQMFGGTAFDANNELAQIAVELAQIVTLQSGTCQVAPPVPLGCHTARANLIASLQDRYNPITPLLGLLITEENALALNPDTFIHDPTVAVQAEKVRIETFLNDLAGIPVTDPIPPAILTANSNAATARINFINNFRIPEMDANLQGSSGYYTSRYNLASLRLKSGGTSQAILFWRNQIYALGIEKTGLIAQKAFLQSLL